MQLHLVERARGSWDLSFASGSDIVCMPRPVRPLLYPSEYTDRSESVLQAIHYTGNQPCAQTALQPFHGSRFLTVQRRIAR